MTLPKLDTPSNVVPLRPRPSVDLCAGGGTTVVPSQDICAGDGTTGNAENRSGNNVVSLPVSLLQVRDAKAPDDVSRICAKPGKLLTDREFVALVNSLTPMELRRRFPMEENSHRDMIRRRLKEYRGCIIDPRYRRFKTFLLDVRQKPAADWTLDRITADRLEYGPGLCRWSRKRDQSANRACTIMLRDTDGTVRPLTEWAALSGQKPDTMRKNYRRRWSDAEVIAGRRTKASDVAPIAEPPPALPMPEPTAEDWPTGVTVKWWEDGWRHFAAHFEAYGQVHGLWDLTRGAFFLWLGQNMQAALWQQLRARYVWCDTPEDEPPEELRADPTFRLYTDYAEAVREVGPVVYADATANACLVGLQRLSRTICRPDDPSLPQLFTVIAAKRHERRLRERIRIGQAARWYDDDDGEA